MGNLPHEAIQPYRAREAAGEPGPEGDHEMSTLEGALKERAARALEEVLAEKLPQIEQAVYAAASRAIERAMNEAAGSAAEPAAVPSAAQPVPGSAAPRTREEAPAVATANARPAPRPRTRHRPMVAPRAPAPPPTNVVRVPARRAPKPVVDKSYERRSPAQIDETKAKVLDQIKETPGRTCEELVAALSAKGFEVSTLSVRLPLRALLKDEAIHHEGDKRYTRYFAGPDPEAKKKPVKKTKAAKR